MSTTRYLLFRAYLLEREEGKRIPVARQVGVGYDDLEDVKAQMKLELAIVPTTAQPLTLEPLNRFVVLELTDTDADGLPDAFKFSDLFTGSTPEPQTPTVRKGKRSKRSG
jgi:hypothetical protein